MISIWTSIISGLCVAIPSILATVVTGRNNREKNNENTALIAYRVDELEKKVMKHNNVIERTYELEKKMALVEDDVKDLKKGK